MEIYTLESGQVIQIVPEVEENSCSGCIGGCGYDSLICDEILDKINSCGHRNVIAIPFVEESTKSSEPKYTVEEVLTAYSLYSCETVWSATIEKIKSELKLKNDPDYKDYLRLKEKFEK
jgi:hypothetical protein